MKCILIVDDAATVRMFHRAILEGAGYVVQEAVNGLEGLEKALSTSYGLFLVDVNMPKMDGYSFLEALRRRPEIAQAPAIMISTEAEMTDRSKAYAAGANFYLTKPVRPADLLLHVGIMLDGPIA